MLVLAKQHRRDDVARQREEHGDACTAVDRCAEVVGDHRDDGDRSQAVELGDVPPAVVDADERGPPMSGHVEHSPEPTTRWCSYHPMPVLQPSSMQPVMGVNVNSSSPLFENTPSGVSTEPSPWLCIEPGFPGPSGSVMVYVPPPVALNGPV